MLTRCTCWVFDLDGTLTVHQHDFDAIRAALGIPPGRLILEYIDTLPRARAAQMHERLAALESELCASAQAAPGADALLALLREHGRHCGILTRSTRGNALATLAAAGLDGYFAPGNVLGRDDALPKPAADGIEHLLERWGGAPGQGVMVGDFRLDLETGRHAGVTTVHVNADASQQWPELTDYRFATLGELHAALSAS